SSAAEETLELPVPPSAAQSAISQEESSKMLELDRLKRDLKNAQKFGGSLSRQRDLERQIRVLTAELQERKAARLQTSHSQAQEAPPPLPAPEATQRAPLYESEQADKLSQPAAATLDLPEWTIEDYRSDLADAEAALERFEALPEDMEPEKVAFRIESLKRKI